MELLHIVDTAFRCFDDSSFKAIIWDVTLVSRKQSSNFHIITFHMQRVIVRTTRSGCRFHTDSDFSIVSNSINLFQQHDTAETLCLRQLIHDVFNKTAPSITCTCAVYLWCLHGWFNEIIFRTNTQKISNMRKRYQDKSHHYDNSSLHIFRNVNIKKNCILMCKGHFYTQIHNQVCVHFCDFEVSRYVHGGVAKYFSYTWAVLNMKKYSNSL